MCTVPHLTEHQQLMKNIGTFPAPGANFPKAANSRGLRLFLLVAFDFTQLSSNNTQELLLELDTF